MVGKRDDVTVAEYVSIGEVRPRVLHVPLLHRVAALATMADRTAILIHLDVGAEALQPPRPPVYLYGGAFGDLGSIFAQFGQVSNTFCLFSEVAGAGPRDILRIHVDFTLDG